MIAIFTHSQSTDCVPITNSNVFCFFQFPSLHCLIKNSIQPLYMKNNNFLTTVTASKALLAHYTTTYSMIGIFSNYMDLQIEGRDVTNQKLMNMLAQI